MAFVREVKLEVALALAGRQGRWGRGGKEFVTVEVVVVVVVALCLHPSCSQQGPAGITHAERSPVSACRPAAGDQAQRDEFSLQQQCPPPGGSASVI